MISSAGRELSRPQALAYTDIWRKFVSLAGQASQLNQNAALTLESLFFRLKETLADTVMEPV